MAAKTLGKLAPSGMLVVIAVLQAFRGDGPHELNVVMAAIAGVLFGNNLQREISHRRSSARAEIESRSQEAGRLVG